ncbi:amidohydrolase family protein [Rhodobacteraceae bacterium 2CG4]|uniref:Amidohydrolase family protein n=1 Tax=Halovulum marinum TaxID=2662447 RepID=A0A6L5Z7E0_9RHOB|nr:amidohydrolase family protein [Halovulum marinum]MSU92070.1 amidohydrolase family protein [Halovulum marinum]
MHRIVRKDLIIGSTLYHNALCLAGDATGPHRADLRIEGGRIAAITPTGAEPKPDDIIVDASRFLAVPGFVNAHFHSPDTLSRGNSPDRPLELWSLSSSASRQSRSMREIEVATLLAGVELARGGVTAVLDHVRISPDLSADALDAVARGWLATGLRVVIAPVVADRPVAETLPFETGDWHGCDVPDVHSGLSANVQIASVADFHSRWHGREGRISVGIGPSGPQRCSDELLVAAAEFSSRTGCIFHSHVLETHLQRAAALKLYGGGMISHLRALECLSPRTNLVHAIWLEPDDPEIIADAGAAVVHNPVSNARLGSGKCDLNRLLAAGVRVGLGTDSPCCNDGCSMAETVKWAALVHRDWQDDGSGWLTPTAALNLGTQVSADAIGLSETGRLRPGNLADINFFSLDAPAYVPLRDPIRQFVLGDTSAAPELVLVGGRAVAAKGRAMLLNEQEIWSEACDLATRRDRTEEAPAALGGPIARMRRRVSAEEARQCH